MKQKRYPSFGFEPLPHPIDGPAINQPGVRYALWRRALTHLRWFGSGAAGLAASITVAETASAWLGVVGIVVAGAATARGTVGLTWTAYVWRHLSRSQWNVLLGAHAIVTDGWPVATVYADGRDVAGNRITFELRIRKSKRAEQFTADGRRELWFAGNPADRGILTPAGGGDMFFARGRLAVNVHRNRHITEVPTMFRPISAAPNRDAMSTKRYGTALAAAKRANLPRPPRRRPVKKRK